jgi:ubiquinone/menaquinone biosynthesis C-methylase UbiE
MKGNTSWGSVAGWYNNVVNDTDSYQTKVILPNILRLVAPEKDKKILDVACGQGYFSHALSTNGAKITGVDISPELINIAKKHAGHNEEFHVASAEDMSKFKENQFDIAISILAIQNIERMGDVFKEISRLVKKDGKFFIVLNHPAFRIPGKSSWEIDQKNSVQYRRVDEYISESRKEIGIEKEVTISFHRPIQAYSKSLANSGFAILRIEEWMSHKESEKGPHKSMEDKARREIPLFMCLECLKIK